MTIGITATIGTIVTEITIVTMGKGEILTKVTIVTLLKKSNKWLWLYSVWIIFVSFVKEGIYAIATW